MILLSQLFLAAWLSVESNSIRAAKEDSSFHSLHRFSNRPILSIHANRFQNHDNLPRCPNEYFRVGSKEFGGTLSDWTVDSICIRLMRASDTGHGPQMPYDCRRNDSICRHPVQREYAGGWSSLKPYHGCISSSAEYTGGADFALNLNDSLALAVMVTAIAGGKHLGTHFLDSIPEDQDPIYTAQIATSRMLCAPGKTEPFHNSERQQFHFGTYPQFRLFRMGGKGILVMRGRDRQDPSRNRVIETTIDLYGMLQSREYFDKTLPDGKHFPSADYGIENGILYRKIVNPQSANATVMDQGWVGLWVDRLLVPDYLRADSVARAQEDSARKCTNPAKTTP